MSGGLIILLGDRGTPSQAACRRPLRGGAQPGLEPETYESRIPSDITGFSSCWKWNSRHVRKQQCLPPFIIWE